MTTTISLSEAYASQSQFEEAIRTLDEGQGRIGRDYRFLPTRVKVLNAMGNLEDAESVVDMCEKRDRKSLANFGKAKTKTLYSSCTSELGYDLKKKREQEREQQREKSQENIKKLKKLFGR